MLIEGDECSQNAEISISRLFFSDFVILPFTCLLEVKYVKTGAPERSRINIMWINDVSAFVGRATRQLAFCPSRRFGKNIFLSMLRAYYDIAQKEKFQKRFGNLWIGEHPTPLQGTFQVLYLDFSRASGGSGSLSENFDRYCSMVMDMFGMSYESYYYPGFANEMKALPDFVSKLNYLNLHAPETGAHLYLISTNMITSPI